MKRGRYYLGRVLKRGEITQQSLRNSILEPQTIRVGDAFWTFTDTFDATDRESPFIFGRLSKYSHEGHLTVVDPETHSQIDAVAENLLLAASPFIYLPDYSGIAYLHVWNGVQEDVFRRRFSSLVEEAHQRFFVECEVEPVADYRAFVSKLRDLDRVIEIRAKVFPPNPLFGDLWKDLNDYIRARRANEVQIAEKSDDSIGLRTNIIRLINYILDRQEGDTYEPAAITDAAILMAADGYGAGKVVGESEENEVTIRTSDTQKHFSFSKDPIIEEFADEVRRRFEAISQERDMRH